MIHKYIASVVFAFVLVLPQRGLREAWAQEHLPFPIPQNWQELPDTALVETSLGDFEIAFYREEAPISVRNFQYRVELGKYENTTFHEYKENFMIQGGDATGSGRSTGYTLPPEISKLRHAVGTIAWARLPNEVNAERRSDGGQFFISLNRNKHLDGQYTIFAHVVRGLSVVERLRAGDRIIRIRLPRAFRGGEQRAVPPGAVAPPPALPENLKPPPSRLPMDGRTVDGDSFSLPQ